MQSGAMRHRLMLQKDHQTKGPDGGPVSNWTTLTASRGRTTIACEVCSATSRELWQAKQVQTDITHAIKVRYARQLMDLTGSVRGVLIAGGNTRTMHLHGSINTGERNREILLTFSEAGDAARVVLDTNGDPLTDPDGDLILEP